MLNFNRQHRRKPAPLKKALRSIALANTIVDNSATLFGRDVANPNMADQRIIVVDDETGVRDTVCSILSQAGYECLPVNSGLEALAFLRANESVSIVLSDLIMEGMDGLTLLARMKQEHPEIPVVMVTAVHDISVALAAIRNGAYDYLLKPFDKEQLLAMVRRALETRRLRLENLAYQTKLESLVAGRTEMLRKTLADLERSYDITLEALGDGEYSPPQRDLVASKSAGIAAAVIALLMGVNDVGGFMQERYLAQNLVAEVGVLAHDGLLFRAQPSGLAQNRVRDRHLADVVQKCATRDDPDALLRQLHGARDGNGERRHPLGVAFGFGVFQVKRIA